MEAQVAALEQLFKDLEAIYLADIIE